AEFASLKATRDTTVKVWHVPTATEQRNLGGHSGGVTCLCAPPPEYCRKLAHTLSLSEKGRLILSGSADCCVKIWSLNTGQCVKSIYTFNAGWSWLTLENCQSVNAHQEAVTSIQGDVCVWENLCSERDPLRLLHHWDSRVTGCRAGQGGRLALSPRGDRLFLGHGRACIRILNWRTVFSLPQCRYVTSLTSDDVPRILCFAAGDVTVRRDARLDSSPQESEGDTEEDDDEDSYDDDDDDEEEDRRSQDASKEGESGSWLRCVVQ
ncbi:hypothetical protein CRUP_004694, partial [Coryphaenoides rupestris]